MVLARWFVVFIIFWLFQVSAAAPSTWRGEAEETGKLDMLGKILDVMAERGE